jgi:uncharacterized protein
VKDPNEVVKVQQRVQVTVLEVDAARKRISLSMRIAAPRTNPPRDAGAARPAAPRAAAPAKPQPAQPAREGWFSAALREGKGKR